MLAAVVGASAKPRRDCPFCPTAFSDVAEMRKHVRYHLERLALYALPDIAEERDDELELERASDSNQVIENKGRKASIGNDFGEPSLAFLASFKGGDEDPERPIEGGSPLSVANLTQLLSPWSASELERQLLTESIASSMPGPATESATIDRVHPADIDDPKIDPDLEQLIIRGCSLEAKRCGIVAESLEGLQMVVTEANNPEILATIQELSRCGNLLHDLADGLVTFDYQYHRPIAITYLDVMLPSLSKSLRVIMAYWEDTTRSLVERWRCIYHDLRRESGISLSSRFVLYRTYLSSLTMFLDDSPDFDTNQLEADRVRVMLLREAAGIRKYSISKRLLVEAKANFAAPPRPVVNTLQESEPSHVIASKF